MKNINLAINFPLPLTIFHFKTAPLVPFKPPGPSFFWTRIKKIRFSHDWEQYVPIFIPKIAVKLLQRFRETWGFRNSWLNEAGKGTEIEVFGIFGVNEWEFYYHVGVDAKKGRLKVFVGGMDKEEDKGLVEHVYDSFCYLLVENNLSEGD